MNITSPAQKPALFTAIAVMTLTSGIINLFWGFLVSATAIGTIVGIVCLPLTVLPTILGLFEIIYAAKLLSSQPDPIKPSSSIAVFQILSSLYGNIFSLVVGILNLIFFNDQAVKAYFAVLNNAADAPVSSPASKPPKMAEAVLPPPADDTPG
jgi:hypothetical protein